MGPRPRVPLFDEAPPGVALIVAKHNAEGVGDAGNAIAIGVAKAKPHNAILLRLGRTGPHYAVLIAQPDEVAVAIALHARAVARVLETVESVPTAREVLAPAIDHLASLSAQCDGWLIRPTTE